MSKVITLDGLREYLTNLKRLFVTKTDAESTYETKANAANIYETKEDAATHLTKTEASKTYITKADAADTYENKTDASKTYVTKTDAAKTYATKSEIIVHDGPEAHNAMWGGRDITAAFDAGTVSANIANGTFRDIFPGDYITKSITIQPLFTTDSPKTYTVNWVIADCDYWINKGDTATTVHHVAIVPQAPIFSAFMNPTNTTIGCYVGSYMHNEVMRVCANGIVDAFGADHILTFRDDLTRDINTDAVSSGITVFTGAPNWNGEWHSQQCNLMSEAMVYGGPHCASSALDNITATRQMSAFRLSERLINYNRMWWWLRDVVSFTHFAFVGGNGDAGATAASGVGGVRPFALLK